MKQRRTQARVCFVLLEWFLLARLKSIDWTSNQISDQINIIFT